MSYISVDIADFKAHVADLLARYPELADDEELRADTFEAETDMVPIIQRLLRRKIDADAMASAIKELKSDNAARQSRFERQSEGYRSLILSVMIAADLDKLQLPAATVSVTAPRTTLEITDLDAIPQGYAKFEKVPDKPAIKAALERGDVIPGASLALSSEGLMVRTK